MRLSRLTIRARITGGSLLIAVLISVIAGVVIYTQVRRIVNDGALAILVNVEAPYLTALREESGESVDPPGPDQLVAVVDPDGVVVVNTLPAGLSRESDVFPRQSGETTTIPVGDSSYLVRVAVVGTTAGSWRVVSAIGNDDQVRVLNEVAALLIGSIAGINVAFGASTWLIGTAALRPVDRLRRSAAALVTEPGDRMLPVGTADDEISQLARTLNELIGALRASADRERQIVSDASHELRTPLAILQTQLELTLAQARSIDEMRTDVVAARLTLARLTELATALLELSRIDSHVESGSATVDEVAAEVADAADRARLRVGGRDILVDYTATVGGDDTVRLGISEVGRVLDNLVSNALRAIGDAGRVALTLSRDTDAIRIDVVDDGGGMDPAFVPLAFDRFSQANRARTGAGAGLGLPIVAGLVASAGGRVEMDNEPGAGVTVRLLIPTRDTGVVSPPA